MHLEFQVILAIVEDNLKENIVGLGWKMDGVPYKTIPTA
jgi:hypothetical protein